MYLFTRLRDLWINQFVLFDQIISHITCLNWNWKRSQGWFLYTFKNKNLKNSRSHPWWFRIRSIKNWNNYKIFHPNDSGEVLCFSIKSRWSGTGYFKETTRNKEVLKTNHVMRNAFDIPILWIGDNSETNSDLKTQNLFIHHSSPISLIWFSIEALKQKQNNRTIYCHVLQLFRANQAMHKKKAARWIDFR